MLSVGVVMVEWMWVTDNERIEKVVYDLRAAVLSGNAEGVLAHLAPNVMYQQGDIAREPEATRSLIRASLNNVHLEFVRISELRTSVGQHTRKGIAEFRAITKGSLRGTSTSIDGMSMTSWSLGFQETEPGVWKINRISPGAIPTGILTMPGGSMPSDGRASAVTTPLRHSRFRTPSIPAEHRWSLEPQIARYANADELTCAHHPQVEAMNVMPVWPAGKWHTSHRITPWSSRLNPKFIDLATNPAA